MKVLIINGSPHKQGCTYTALHEVEKILNEERIETVYVNVPADCPSCMACDYCHRTHEGCVLKDQVNETPDGLVSCEEEISNLEESLAEMTKGAGDSEASVRAFANSLQDYMDALGEEHMEEFAKAMDGITDSSEEFAKMLSYAGVSAEDFAKIGSEGFHNLYKAADGDIQRIGIALAMLDAMHIDPVKMHVEDDGSIKDTEGRIWDLDAATGTLTEGDHVYKLTADGIVEVTEQAEDAENQLTDATDETYEVDMDSSKVVAANDRLGEMYKLSTTINGYNATANVNVRDNASWKLDEIKRTLWNLSGRTITVGVDAIFSKLGFSATGGFLDMRSHRPRHRPLRRAPHRRRGRPRVGHAPR